ncbi:MAG: hypothetical protein GXP31_08860 [Kiritimatiellaeota bacterium]|nr:hypothetical protein [Kiritimatiellota bacterium]
MQHFHLTSMKTLPMPQAARFLRRDRRPFLGSLHGVALQWVMLAGGLWSLGHSLGAGPVVTLDIGSSPNPVGSGARALGQGNAFIAVADDATAASWNPGGLSQLERPELSLAIETVRRREGTYFGGASGNDSADTLRLNDFNYVSIGFPFFWRRNMVLYLNYLKLYNFNKTLDYPYARDFGGGLKVDEDFSFHQSGDFSVIGPAFGIDVTAKLSLGMALNIWNDGVTRSSSFTKTTRRTGTVSFAGLQDRYTLVAENQFRVNQGYSVVFGGLYRLSKTWAFGAVFKPGYTLGIDHRRTQTYEQLGTLNPHTDPPVDETRDAKLHFPTILGTGIAWRPRDPVTVSADLTWTDWSQYSLHENGRDTNPVTGQSLDQSRLRDTVTLRLGAEYVFILEKYLVPLRCGIGYDPAPAVGDTDDFYTLSVGGGLQAGRFMLDLAYEFRWGNGVNKDSFQGLDAAQDVRRHRILVSVIYYF